MESTAAKGSIFTLSIPASPAKKIDKVRIPEKTPDAPNCFRRSPGPAPSAYPAGGGQRGHLELISLRSRQAGAEVVTAENGLEALDRTSESSLEGRPFDLLIMDMQMPVLDGYDAVRQLRPCGLTMPILACTAFAMTEDRDDVSSWAATTLSASPFSGIASWPSSIDC